MMAYLTRLKAASLALSVVLSAPAAAGEAPWVLTVASNAGRFSASGIDASGSQSLGYMQISHNKEKWGAAVTSTYASTSYDAIDTAEGGFDLSSFTDTGIVTYYNTEVGDVGLRMGVDLGLPTGVSALDEEQHSNVISDDVSEDILLLNAFGAGYSAVLHAGTSYNTGSLTWGLGVRYLYNGEYDTTSYIDDGKYDPGDSVTLVGSLDADLNENVDALLLALSYTTSGKDKQDGESVFKNGDIYSIEARYTRNWMDGLTSTLAGVFTRQNKNERPDDNGGLKAETGNSNANVIRLFIENAYRYNRQWTITFVAGYKTVAANDLADDDPYYDAGRNKVYAEPGFIWRFSESAYAMVRLMYASVNDRKDSFAPEDATYTVVNADASLVFNF